MSRPVDRPMSPLRLWRKSKRFTQAKLAKLAGVDQAYVCVVERGVSLACKTSFQRIEDATGGAVTHGKMIVWYYGLTAADLESVDLGSIAS